MFSRTWVVDCAERALATAAEAALGIYVLAGPGDLFSISLAEGAAASGVIAGLAVIKGALATKVGDSTGASLAPDLVVVDTTNPGA